MPTDRQISPRHRFVCQYLAILFVQLVHSSGACTACSLIGGYVYGFYMRKLFDGFQCHYHLDSSTVRVGDNAARTVFNASAAFTSGTTKGTSASIRKALELSIITAPYLVIGFKNSLDVPAPAEVKAMSTPLKSSLCCKEFNLDLFTAEGIFSAGTAFRTEQN